MRSLQRSCRDLYYANRISEEPIIDDYGNDTLETRSVYGKPTLLKLNVSANVGQDMVNVFGSMTEYHRTASFMGTNCPLVEGSRIWFGVSPDGDHNYVVTKVADSKNRCLIALREVSNRV